MCFVTGIIREGSRMEVLVRVVNTNVAYVRYRALVVLFVLFFARHLPTLSMEMCLFCLP